MRLELDGDLLAGRERLNGRFGHAVGMTAQSAAPSVFRPGGVSYLRIPAPDPARAVGFYSAVFGWDVDSRSDEPRFTDGSGHVIGHFVPDAAVAGEAGIRPYIYVEHLDDVLNRVMALGGAMVAPPYEEGDLWVSTIRDPAGNVIGLWQHGGRN